jgi:L-malate glycosyltransferase
VTTLRIGITCYPTFGGSGVVATELGVALAQRGFEVHFISSRLPARLERTHLADVSFHEVNTYNYALFQHAPYTLTLAAKMAEVAETFALDILHVHYAIPHAVSAHLARAILQGKLRVMTTLHGTDITLVGSDPSMHSITRFAINDADSLTTVSEWLKNETIKEFNPVKPVHVIPNFIDTEAFRPDLHCEWAGKRYLCAGHPHLIHVSNFRPVKRAPEAVEVLAKVLKQRDVHLLMVGDGPDLQRAVGKAKELGVTHRVSFLGNREDVAYLLASADIMLLPSESESFGLAALEAMASGCAVVASNIGGLPEVFNDGEGGFLCPLGNTDMMAQRVLELIDNPSQLCDFKRQAHAHAVENFSRDAIVPRYIALYDQLMQEGGR